MELSSGKDIDTDGLLITKPAATFAFSFYNHADA